MKKGATKMNVKTLILTNRHFQDLNPLLAGEEVCDPGHSFGPAVRKYTLIHYVVRGKGILYSRGGIHPVEQGQAFLILPGEVTTYIADNQDPWYYRWIGFDGGLSSRFAELPPVFSLPEDILRRILCVAEDPEVIEYRLAAELFQLYSQLFSGTGGSNRHVRRVENYIRSAYMQPLRVEQIATQMNLNRRYLSRLFKEKTGQSIQDYLISVRLEEAKHYLMQGHSVKEAAYLVGYDDVSNFSKIFKKRYGQSPATIGSQN